MSEDVSSKVKNSADHLRIDEKQSNRRSKFYR